MCEFGVWYSDWRGRYNVSCACLPVDESTAVLLTHKAGMSSSHHPGPAL